VRGHSWLHAFVAAVAWSVLAGIDGSAAAIDIDLQTRVHSARETWRRAAVGGRSMDGPHELHMLPIAELTDDGRQELYAAQLGQLQPLVARTGDAFVWMKLPGVLCLGSLRGQALGDIADLSASSTWVRSSQPIPGIVRFLMFEELERSLAWCREVDLLADAPKGAQRRPASV
jgi:hypothetical protein